MAGSAQTDPFPRPIAHRFGQLVAAFGPRPLADLPTPVEALADLGRFLGRDGLWVKRDDRSSSLYGGNKVRKLEFLLGPARRASCRTLLTMGGCGSNHLLATALHGRREGMRTVGVIFDQPDNRFVRRNQAAYRGAGVALWPIASKYALPAAVAAAWLKILHTEGQAPHLVPGGGSSPLGALGFVNAGLELGQQVRAGALPEPEAIFLPYGTGGTAAGLAIGLQLAGLRSRVRAVRVIDRLLANRPRLEWFGRAIWRLLAHHIPGLKRPGRPLSRLDLVEGFIGPGYGVATEEGRAAMQAFADFEGLDLEPTYTGKAAAAFIQAARSGAGPLLLWNTFSSANIDRFIAAGADPAAGAEGR